ncbi:MAG: circadian clock protein KaiC [Methanotrichaceae archaeon]
MDTAKAQAKSKAGIPKVPTGIPGFDEIADGGIPKSRTTLVVGGPGCGKTIFALQTLVNGAREFDEPGIFVAFEENSKQIVANAATFNWNLSEMDGRLFFLDAPMFPEIIDAGDFDLTGMLAALKAKAEAMGAKRIVFDSIDVLLSMLDEPKAKRRELYRVRDWLSQNMITGIITARIEDKELSQHENDFLQYMADCVVAFSHHMVDTASLREARIAKYRGSSFAENEFSLVIGPRGMEIANLRTSEPEIEVPDEKISTGVERFDKMLYGGYQRGSSVLITGAPGTAKSTLCAAFIDAACKRGEKALYINFEETSKKSVRNFESVNIHLKPYLDSGLLKMQTARIESMSAEEHLMMMRKLIEEHKPTCMVVDPISSMSQAGGRLNARGLAQRLIHMTESKGITFLCTCLVEGREPLAEKTEIRISSIADTWVHLAYVPQGGERNRSLSIIKARGTKHSNQIREMILSDEGIDLTDVYISGGEALMGTMRFEKEASEKLEEEMARKEAEQRSTDLDLAEAEIKAKMETLKRDLEANRAAKARIDGMEISRLKGLKDKANNIRKLRKGDTQI